MATGSNSSTNRRRTAGTRDRRHRCAGDHRAAAGSGRGDRRLCPGAAGRCARRRDRSGARRAGRRRQRRGGARAGGHGRRGRARRGCVGTAGAVGQRRQLRGARGDGRRGGSGASRQPHGDRPRARRDWTCGPESCGSSGNWVSPRSMSTRGAPSPIRRCSVTAGTRRPADSHRWCGWNDRCAQRLAGAGNRIGDRSGKAACSDWHGPRKRSAAKPRKSNCYPSRNSFRPPMSPFCRDWVVALSANHASRRRPRRSRRWRL